MFSIVGSSLAELLQNINNFHGNIKIAYFTQGVRFAQFAPTSDDQPRSTHLPLGPISRALYFLFFPFSLSSSRVARLEARFGLDVAACVLCDSSDALCYAPFRL